jgi:hypothetical protein
MVGGRGCKDLVMPQGSSGGLLLAHTCVSGQLLLMCAHLRWCELCCIVAAMYFAGLAMAAVSVMATVSGAAAGNTPL